MTLKNQDRTMFGTKIYNNKTKEYGIIIYTWTNQFADGEVPFATCVDTNGKKYNAPMDDMTLAEDMDEE